jgi:hypothetical protein
MSLGSFRLSFALSHTNVSIISRRIFLSHVSHVSPVKIKNNRAYSFDKQTVFKLENKNTIEIIRAIVVFQSQLYGIAATAHPCLLILSLHKAIQFIFFLEIFALRRH